MAYVVHEELVAGVPSSNQVTVTFPEPIEAGDTLVLMVGGGNQVPSVPSGWTSHDFRTGQEAQGRVMSRVVADASAGGLDVTVTFDGNDRCGIALVHVRGECGVGVPFAQRVGAVGASYPAGVVGTATADNTLTYLFSFQRNSGGSYSTIDDTVLVAGLPNGSEGTSLYRVAAATTPAWSLTAGRSGHYLAAVEIYSIVRGDWFYNFEHWQSTTTATAKWRQGVYADAALPGKPTTRQDANAKAWMGDDDLTFTDPASLPSELRTDYYNFGGTTLDGWVTNWLTNFYNIERDSGAWNSAGFNGHPPADVYDPDTDSYLDDGVIGHEWFEGSLTPTAQRARAIVTLMNVISSASTIPEGDRRIYFYALPGTYGAASPSTFLSPSTLTLVGTYLGSLTLAQWTARTGSTVALDFVTVPGSPSSAQRLMIYGVDEATASASAYDTTAVPDGMRWDNAGDVQQRYTIPYRLIYRGVVNVGPPPVVSVLRRYPRKDPHGFGNAKRNYALEHPARNYGQIP